MTQNVILDGCSCICQNVTQSFTTTETIMAKVPMTSWEKIQIMLIVLVTIFIIVGLIIGFRKLQGHDEFDEVEDEQDKRYY